MYIFLKFLVCTFPFETYCLIKPLCIGMLYKHFCIEWIRWVVYLWILVFLLYIYTHLLCLSLFKFCLVYSPVIIPYGCEQVLCQPCANSRKVLFTPLGLTRRMFRAWLWVRVWHKVCMVLSVYPWVWEKDLGSCIFIWQQSYFVIKLRLEADIS